MALQKPATGSRTGAGATATELRGVVALAAPIVAAQVGMIMLGAVDAAMLGRVSKEALAAGALGATLSFGVLSVPIGLIMALDPLIAQAWGARRKRRLRSVFERGVALTVLLVPPTLVVLLIASRNLRLLGQSPEIAPLALQYIDGLLPGVLPFLLFVALRQTEQAMGIVRPALLAALGANVFNVGANWVLVFGNLGVPAYGVRGSAWATSLSRWVLLGLLVWLSWGAVGRLFRIRPWRWWRPSEHLAMLRIGLPISVQRSLEFWVFSAVGLMMGTLGALEMSSHQIALNLASISFMVPLGVGAAAATRVGNAIGRGDALAARAAAWGSLGLGAAFMVISASLFASIPATLARIYTADATVIRLASTLLPIAAAFQLSDSIQVVASGVLRGTADTRWPAMLSFIGFWVLGLPLGWWLAFRGGYGPAGLWWGLTLGLTTVAVLLLARVTVRLKQPLEQLQV